MSVEASRGQTLRPVCLKVVWGFLRGSRPVIEWNLKWYVKYLEASIHKEGTKDF